MNSKKNKTFINIIASFLSFSIAVGAAFWYLQNESIELFPTFFCILIVIGVCRVITNLADNLNIFFFLVPIENYEKTFAPDEMDIKNTLKIIGFSFVWLVLLFFIIIFFINFSYPSLDLKDSLSLHFSSYLDTNKFIHISNNWYKNINNFDGYKNIFPLYPILLKIFSMFNNPILIGIFLNIIFASISGGLLYNIGLFDYEEEVSLKSVIYLYIFPSSFFLILPISNSLFFMLSLIYVYFILRRNWSLSFIVGYLVGFSHPYSLILIVFFVSEFIENIRETKSESRDYDNINMNKDPLFFIEEKNKTNEIKNFILKALSFISIPISYLFFITSNKEIYLNSANIIIKIQDLFLESRNYFFSNAFNLISYIVDRKDYSLKIIPGTYLPVLISFVVVIFLLLKFGDKIRGSYYLYILVFYLVSFSSENFLESSKYLINMFPIFFILASISENLKINILISLISLILFIIYLYLFINGYPVY